MGLEKTIHKIVADAVVFSLLKNYDMSSELDIPPESLYGTTYTTKGGIIRKLEPNLEKKLNDAKNSNKVVEIPDYVGEGTLLQIVFNAADDSDEGPNLQSYPDDILLNHVQEAIQEYFLNMLRACSDEESGRVIAKTYRPHAIRVSVTKVKEPKQDAYRIEFTAYGGHGNSKEIEEIFKKKKVTQMTGIMKGAALRKAIDVRTANEQGGFGFDTSSRLMQALGREFEIPAYNDPKDENYAMPTGGIIKAKPRLVLPKQYVQHLLTNAPRTKDNAPIMRVGSHGLTLGMDDLKEIEWKYITLPKREIALPFCTLKVIESSVKPADTQPSILLGSEFMIFADMQPWDSPMDFWENYLRSTEWENTLKASTSYDMGVKPKVLVVGQNAGKIINLLNLADVEATVYPLKIPEINFRNADIALRDFPYTAPLEFLPVKNIVGTPLNPEYNVILCDSVFHASAFDPKMGLENLASRLVKYGAFVGNVSADFEYTRAFWQHIRKRNMSSQEIAFFGEDANCRKIHDMLMNSASRFGMLFLGDDKDTRHALRDISFSDFYKIISHRGLQYLEAMKR